MSKAPAYDVRNLHKVYPNPRVLANESISFSAEPGEAFGVLGPNGAGKSTLVRQLVGLLVPTSGEVRLFGEAVRAGAPRIGRTVAYLPQGGLALGELRVAEAVRSVAMLRGMGRAGAVAESDELLGALGLEGAADRSLRKLSGGQRRLVQIAMTLAARLPVLILDEPTADIDPALRKQVWALVSDRTRAGSCVLLVTHDVAEAEHALDRVAILDRGRMVASGTPASLKADLSHRTRVELVLREDSGVDARAVASDLGGDTRVRGRHISAWVGSEYAVAALDKALSAVGGDRFEDIRLISPTLEDVYLELAGRSLDEVEP
jgi:ABC-2 type transport system ATP-binding protein